MGDSVKNQPSGSRFLRHLVPAEWRIIMQDNNNLLNMDDLADVFAQLSDIEDAPEELTEEEKASQRRYEEIIRKHKNNN